MTGAQIFHEMMRDHKVEKVFIYPLGHGQSCPHKSFLSILTVQFGEGAAERGRGDLVSQE
jgi:hypothetical protein